MSTTKPTLLPIRSVTATTTASAANEQTVHISKGAGAGARLRPHAACGLPQRSMRTTEQVGKPAGGRPTRRSPLTSRSPQKRSAREQRQRAGLRLTAPALEQQGEVTRLAPSSCRKEGTSPWLRTARPSVP